MFLRLAQLISSTLMSSPYTSSPKSYAPTYGIKVNCQLQLLQYALIQPDEAHCHLTKLQLHLQINQKRILQNTKKTMHLLKNAKLTYTGTLQVHSISTEIYSICLSFSVPGYVKHFCSAFISANLSAKMKDYHSSSSSKCPSK